MTCCRVLYSDHTLLQNPVFCLNGNSGAESESLSEFFVLEYLHVDTKINQISKEKAAQSLLKVHELSGVDVQVRRPPSKRNVTRNLRLRYEWKFCHDSGNALFVQIGLLLTELLVFKANEGKVMQGSILLSFI